MTSPCAWTLPPPPPHPPPPPPEQEYQKAGADQVTFHLESVVSEPVAVGTDKDAAVSEVIAAIKDAGMYVGIALKPGTPAEAVFPYVEDIDMVSVMQIRRRNDGSQ